MRDGGGCGGQHRIGFLRARQRRILSLSPRLKLLAKCILENWSERADRDYLFRFQSTHQSFPVGSGTGQMLRDKANSWPLGRMRTCSLIRICV